MKVKKDHFRIKSVLCQVLSATVLLTIGCSDDSGSESDDFDRSVMLDNIGKNIILPNYQDFHQATLLLRDAATDFADSPSSQNLLELQAKWQTAASSWKSVEMIDLGPIDQLALKTSIDNWPTNTIAIEDAIATDEVINEDFVKSLGSSSKGLPAIEYLIFDPEAENQVVLNELTGSTNRLLYLQALCQNLSSLAGQLSNGWDPADGNYLNTFVQTDGKDVGSSINMLANNIIFLTEIVKNDKLGVPLGKKSLGELLPKDAEAWRSQLSLAFILENLRTLKDIYTGLNGAGFDDYLDHVDAKDLQGEALSQIIEAQFDSSIEAAEAISMPLVDALTLEKDKVEQAFDETQLLVVLLKADMMSSLGLLVTFSDNDGD